MLPLPLVPPHASPWGFFSFFLSGQKTFLLLGTFVFLFTCLTLTCHSCLSSEVPSSGTLSLISQASPGLPQILKCPSSELKLVGLSFPITALTTPDCCWLSPAQLNSRVWATWDRVWAFLSHCCVLSITQCKIRPRAAPPPLLSYVWPWARPLTSLPQRLLFICELSGSPLAAAGLGGQGGADSGSSPGQPDSVFWSNMSPTGPQRAEQCGSDLGVEWHQFSALP